MTQPTVSTEKTKRIIQRREEGGKMRKINMMTLGPRLSIYLPTYLSIVHFLCVSLEIEGTRGLFCGTAPLLYSLVSFHATQSALSVPQSQTLGNQCDTCRSLAPNPQITQLFSVTMCLTLVWPGQTLLLVTCWMYNRQGWHSFFLA